MIQVLYFQSPRRSDNRMDLQGCFGKYQRMLSLWTKRTERKKLICSLVLLTRIGLRLLVWLVPFSRFLQVCQVVLDSVR